MSADVQTLLALGVVAIAATGLVWRFFGKRKSTGCGGGCGCASTDLKSKLKR